MHHNQAVHYKAGACTCKFQTADSCGATRDGRKDLCSGEKTASFGIRSLKRCSRHHRPRKYLAAMLWALVKNDQRKYMQSLDALQVPHYPAMQAFSVLLLADPMPLKILMSPTPTITGRVNAPCMAILEGKAQRLRPQHVLHESRVGWRLTRDA